ncbi:MAG: polymer-forming cytoskeletal protein [Polyangiales bacterium]
MSRWAARAALCAMLWMSGLEGAARAEVASDAGANRDDDAGVAEPLSELRREGAWPSDERVTLKVEAMPRAEAIRKLADAVGWSVIVRGVGNEPVDVRVVKQPAARVLELILAGEPFVARRDGTMIAIARAADVAPIDARLRPPSGPNMPVPPPPPEPPPPPKPPKMPGSDKLVTAGNSVIRADEVVANLTVLAGNVDVYGTINEDLAVFAGNVRVRPGAVVHGDVSAVAGNVKIDEGAQIEGDVSGVVGHVSRGDRAHDDDDTAADDEDADDAEAARAIARKYKRWARDFDPHDPKHRDADDEDEDDADAETGVFARVEQAGNAVARSALLFAFGAVVLAFAGTRAQRLQAEAAARPLHALVVGGVSLTIAVIAMFVLTVTIIGIPLVLFGILALAVGTYVGICAALTALGRALLHARTPSPYLHLALGCALYLVASSLPGIGWLVTAAVVMIGVGALVRTRAGGLFSRSHPPSIPPAPPAAPSTALGPEL